MTASRGGVRIVAATQHDVADLHRLVRALAEYERLTALCTSTEADLRDALFGAHPVAEALIARLDANSEICIGFALFFLTYSTFLGRRSLWLEDLFVEPAHRGRGAGKALLGALARIGMPLGEPPVACERPGRTARSLAEQPSAPGARIARRANDRCARPHRHAAGRATRCV